MNLGLDIGTSSVKGVLIDTTAAAAGGDTHIVSPEEAMRVAMARQ